MMTDDEKRAEIEASREQYYQHPPPEWLPRCASAFRCIAAITLDRAEARASEALAEKDAEIARLKDGLTEVRDALVASRHDIMVEDLIEIATAALTKEAW